MADPAFVRTNPGLTFNIDTNRDRSRALSADNGISCIPFFAEISPERGGQMTLNKFIREYLRRHLHGHERGYFILLAGENQ